MLRWVLEKELARGQRPGYGGERGTPVSQSEVDAWIQDVKAFGAKSIICLLAEDQLQLYNSLPADLVSYYRQSGLVVTHVPARDHQQPPLTNAHLEQIWWAYNALPKPVLVHCSAGVDRTGIAIDFICERLRRLALYLSGASAIISAADVRAVFFDGSVLDLVAKNCKEYFHDRSPCDASGKAGACR